MSRAAKAAASSKEPCLCTHCVNVRAGRPTERYDIVTRAYAGWMSDAAVAKRHGTVVPRRRAGSVWTAVAAPDGGWKVAKAGVVAAMLPVTKAEAIAESLERNRRASMRGRLFRVTHPHTCGALDRDATGEALLRANGDDSEICDFIYNANVGATLRTGGGAAPTIDIERVK